MNHPSPTGAHASTAHPTPADAPAAGDQTTAESEETAAAGDQTATADDEAVDDVFDLGAAAETAALHRLHVRLAADAVAAGVLDVAYTTVDSPVGPLLLAGTPQGLVRVAYVVQDHAAVLQQLADRVSARVLRDPGRLDPVARQLDEYFAGRRTVFELPLDLRLAHGFRHTVLRHVSGIAHGHTASYAAVAAAAGSPRAVRAVGSACATNPLPVVVPCHRVVRRDGGMGEYVGGTAAKRALLTLEAPT